MSLTGSSGPPREGWGQHRVQLTWQCGSWEQTAVALQEQFVLPGTVSVPCPKLFILDLLGGR